MKHKLYVDGELIYSSRWKILCELKFDWRIRHKKSRDECVTMVSDYTRDD